MSSRALRRLREEKEAEEQKRLSQLEEEEDESEEEEEDDVKRGGFHMMMMDDSSSSSSDEEEESDDEEEKSGDEEEEGGEEEEEESEKEEDIDAILSEFQSTNKISSNNNTNTSPLNTLSTLLYQTNDTRDFDLDYSMRTILGADNIDIPQQQQVVAPPPRGRGGRRVVGNNANNATAAGSLLSSRRRYLFGTPNVQWGRPPTYLGGGLGMVTIDYSENDADESSCPPWPYSTFTNNDDDDDDDAISTSSPDNYYQPQNTTWYTYNPSDTYTTLTKHYDSLTNTSTARGGAMGDVNSLALFVAENPYYTEATLQLAMVLFHVNDRQRGMELLFRCLWIYECAGIQGFLPNQKKVGKKGGTNGSSTANSSVALMDYEERINNGFFSALFRLMQTSSMVGCLNTSFAISKFLLSLDPLRDPMGVLLILDYFALASSPPSVTENETFLVDSVDSNMVQIYHRDDDVDKKNSSAAIPSYKCNLIDMPNWAYSYALALYRLSLDDDNDDDGELISSKANKALQSALSKFPSVLPLLLEKNNIDVQGRSFKTDWPSVLPFFGMKSVCTSTTKDGTAAKDENMLDEHTLKCAKMGADRIITIFVQRSFKLWAADDVVAWLYDNCVKVMEEEGSGKKETSAEEEVDDVKSKAEGQAVSTFQPSPALIRYLRCDPSDYEDSFRTLPADANPLDEALLGPVMALDPNRRRFLRRNRGGRNAEEEELELQRQMMMMQAGGVALGGEMVNIDPDLPLLEVFWRSLLPWARVEGVPPPRR